MKRASTPSARRCGARKTPDKSSFFGFDSRAAGRTLTTDGSAFASSPPNRSTRASLAEASPTYRHIFVRRIDIRHAATLFLFFRGDITVEQMIESFP